MPVYVGGAYGNASGAGLFCWNLNNPGSNASSSIGCRLARSTRSRVSYGIADSVPLGAGIPSLRKQGEQARAGAISRRKPNMAPVLKSKEI